MYSEVIKLLKEVEVVDEFGDIKRTYEEREVFARKDRIYLSESLQAMAQGFQRQLRFTISDFYDYNDEEELMYKDKKYKIVNVQEKGTELEINCVLGVGENGK